MRETPESIEIVIFDALAAACRVSKSSLTPTTRLIDLALDSLTLVVVITVVEAALETSFDADDLADLLNARVAGDLTRIVARRLHRGESKNSPQSRE